MTPVHHEYLMGTVSRATVECRPVLDGIELSTKTCRVPGELRKLCVGNKLGKINCVWKSSRACEPFSLVLANYRCVILDRDRRRKLSLSVCRENFRETSIRIRFCVMDVRNKIVPYFICMRAIFSIVSIVQCFSDI